jgi:hypothetical protein
MEITIDALRCRTRPDTVHGCWVWTGGKDREGYGRWEIAENRFGTRAAHRIAFYLGNGYLPEWPLVVDHICGNKSCVNPEHLRVLHHLDNALRGVGLTRSKTCPAGHNRWRYRAKGGRECLDCRNTFKKRYRSRKKAGLV